MSYMRYGVIHVDGQGVQSLAATFSTKSEAEDSAEWLRENRDPSQWLDGTTFMVTPMPEASDDE